MNIRNKINTELSEMTFESVKEKMSDVTVIQPNTASRNKKCSRRITATVIAAAATLTLGISVAALWSISGLAGRNIDELTADECAELEGFVVAETTVESNEISVNSVLYDGNLIYINLKSDTLWFETLALSESENYEFSDDDSFVFPGLLEITEGTFNPVSGSYGDSFSGIFQITEPLSEGEAIYAHVQLENDVMTSVKITVPQISAPKIFTVSNDEGESFEIHITPISAVCKGTGRLYSSYGGVKYNLPLLLRDKDGNVIFSQIAQGHETDENDCLIPFDTILDVDRVKTVKLGSYTNG